MKTSYRISLLGTLLALVTVGHVAAQGAQAPPNAQHATPTAFQGYDAISIKPNKTGSGSTHFDMYDRTLNVTNTSIAALLTDAYGIRESLISGLPDWAKSTRWDISAKVVEPAPSSETSKRSVEENRAARQAQVRSILTDRFGLNAHTVMETQPVFDLEIAKGGCKLVTADPAQKDNGSISTHNQVLRATGVPISSLTLFLSRETGRNVVDRTGLKGLFNMELHWSREEQLASGADNGSADKPPVIFTAIQEQMGLKLVSDKGPVEALVVDSITAPAPD